MRIALPWDDQPRLAAAQFVVLGEVHGTAEAPAFISALADARTATRPLSIGLEMAASEQETIDRFLASAWIVGFEGEWRRTAGGQQGAKRELAGASDR